jgi:hypothetical protein
MTRRNLFGIIAAALMPKPKALAMDKMSRVGRIWNGVIEDDIVGHQHGLMDAAKIKSAYERFAKETAASKMFYESYNRGQWTVTEINWSLE